MIQAFHGPLIYYDRVLIAVKNYKMQIYQLMSALFGRPTYLRLQELKCSTAAAATSSVQSGAVQSSTLCGRVVLRSAFSETHIINFDAGK